MTLPKEQDVTYRQNGRTSCRLYVGEMGELKSKSPRCRTEHKSIQRRGRYTPIGSWAKMNGTKNLTTGLYRTQTHWFP